MGCIQHPLDITDEDENKDIIKSFWSIFRGGAQIIIWVELLFLVQIVPGTDLSGTPTKYSVS